MPRSNSHSDCNQGNNLYLANLAPETTESELTEIFSHYGRILSLQIVLDQATRKSRGYAFLLFEKTEEASKAMEQLNGLSINRQQIRIEKARRAGPRSSTPGRYMGRERRRRRSSTPRSRSRSRRRYRRRRSDSFSSDSSGRRYRRRRD